MSTRLSGLIWARSSSSTGFQPTCVSSNPSSLAHLHASIYLGKQTSNAIHQAGKYSTNCLQLTIAFEILVLKLDSAQTQLNTFPASNPVLKSPLCKIALCSRKLHALPSTMATSRVLLIAAALALVCVVGTCSHANHYPSSIYVLGCCSL